MTKQLLFTWSSEDDSEAEGGADAVAEPSTGTARRQAIRRAVLRWLELTAEPTGLATQVVTRIQRNRADVAAFWSAPVRNSAGEGPDRVLAPVRTTIIQCYAERDECWPDCARSQEMLPKLKAIRAELHELEAVIRRDEPELRDGAALFEEYAVWRYEDSRNRNYQRLRRALNRVERSLYEGTAFERIGSAQLADQLYLAVPAGLIEPEELADGWGLLWVDEDLSVRVMIEAQEHECLAGNRLHLVQHIAAAAKASELMANGVARREEEVLFTRPVRRRRAPDSPRLPQP